MLAEQGGRGFGPASQGSVRQRAAALALGTTWLCCPPARALCTHTRSLSLSLLLSSLSLLVEVDSFLSSVQVRLMQMLKQEEGIAQILGFFEDDHFYYIIMEHCAGGDLYHKLILNREFDEHWACRKVSR